MWILLAVVLRVISPEETIPILDKPLVYNSFKECDVKMQKIYNEFRLLQANYPVEIEYKINDNNQKYLVYSYIPDYNKPKVTTYYYCIKTYTK